MIIIAFHEIDVKRGWSHYIYCHWVHYCFYRPTTFKKSILLSITHGFLMLVLYLASNDRFSTMINLALIWSSRCIFYTLTILPFALSVFDLLIFFWTCTHMLYRELTLYFWRSYCTLFFTISFVDKAYLIAFYRNIFYMYILINYTKNDHWGMVLPRLFFFSLKAMRHMGMEQYMMQAQKETRGNRRTCSHTQSFFPCHFIPSTMLLNECTSESKTVLLDHIHNIYLFIYWFIYFRGNMY